MEWAQLQEYANHGLTWIGFGTLLGLTAKAIMPGRDPAGPIATIVMGIVGTLIGCALLKFFYPSEMILPFSFKGFFVGTAGAFVILSCYRVLGGYGFMDGEQYSFRSNRRRRREREVRSLLLDD